MLSMYVKKIQLTHRLKKRSYLKIFRFFKKQKIVEEASNWYIKAVQSELKIISAQRK